MAHFYFDLKDGVTQRDRIGYDCYDERQAFHRADNLAADAAIEHPQLVGEAYISVIDSRGSEIYRSLLVINSPKTRNASD